MIKEVIGKEKIQQQNFPQKICIGNKEITDLKTIAEKFNKFFTEIGPNLVKDIDPSSVTFDNYLKTFNANQPEHNLTVNELKDAFFSLKLNKSPGYDEISFNVIKTYFGSLHKPLLHIFNQFLQSGISPDKLKTARVTLSFEKGSDSKLENYRPISVLPCFSKILEKIMYDRLYKHLKDEDILYKNNLAFNKNSQLNMLYYN